jgi:hypothetical protein
VEQETGIWLKTRVHPLALILRVCKVIVTIDGVDSTRRWGRHFFPLPAGNHEVLVSFRYLTQQLGQASTSVAVPTGSAVEVEYESPSMLSLMLTSRAGRITADGRG